MLDLPVWDGTFVLNPGNPLVPLTFSFLSFFSPLLSLIDFSPTLKSQRGHGGDR